MGAYFLVVNPARRQYLSPSRFGELVNAELRARSDDSVGTQLVAACVKKP